MPATLGLAADTIEKPFRQSARHHTAKILRICDARRTGSPQKPSARQNGTLLQLNFGPRATAGAESSSAPAKQVAKPVACFSEQDRRHAAWMMAAQAGDRSAYECLVRESIPFVKMVARKQGVSADLIDDVVQETLLTVHRIRWSYDSARPFMAWLRTIAQRRAIDVMRSRGRTSLREVYEPLAFENHSDPAGTPEDQAGQMECKSLLGAAVASLPARQREAVEQLALKGRSLVDAAVAIGLTPGALKVNFHRALKTLRAQMGAEKTISGRDRSKLQAHDTIAEASVSKNLKHALVKFAM